MRSSTKALILGIAVASTLTLAGRGLVSPANATGEVVKTDFAVMDSIGLLEQMLQSDEYTAAREDGQTGFENQMNSLQQANAALTTQLQTMDQNDPNFQVGVAEYQRQQAQMQQLNTLFSQEFDAMLAQQAIEIFTKITAATNAVADREGIDTVIANRPVPDESLTFGLAGVTQHILARPIVRSNALDLTVAIREELGLPDPEVAAAEAAAEAAKAAEEAETSGLELENGGVIIPADQGDEIEPVTDTNEETDPADDGEG